MGIKPSRFSAVFAQRLSLAGQYLILQLLIIAVVLAGVVAVSLTQSTNNFEKVEGRRSLSAAESLAANPLLRVLIPNAAPEMGSALPAMAETTRSTSGLQFVVLADRYGTVITSTFPGDVGTSILHPESQVAQGRGWTGDITRNGERVLIAQVPVLNDEGSMVCIVSAGQSYPSTRELIQEIAPSALITLVIAVALGAIGSVLLSRRVKHQTRGMEPREIAELFEHREALLHGVKEGIISVSPDSRVMLANDIAIELLQLPLDCVGQTLTELDVAPQVSRALTTQQQQPDRQFLIGERVVVFNRMPVKTARKDHGSVTTFRDRTELTLLEQELGDSKATADMLRSQTHEFANHLHAISGLIQLQEYDEVIGFIDGVSFSRSKVFEDVTAHIAEPTIAALLIAKASVATERGIKLEVSNDSRLERGDEQIARDLTTVIGNLLDNAMDALAEVPEPKIELSIQEIDEIITVKVTDNGAGIADDAMKEIFTQGFSTKDTTVSGGRGFGLALSRLVCRRRQGDITVVNDRGAQFTATLRK
ncbi:sensor histidine kinase [Arthrobacter sp. NIO-1057]|uniref:sensor histidine kinase n=1 Tax=Arthrobacter sp. NIO-1057 TaxID=993071 RepID=UPI0008179CC9|nr:ATP-binding protein [Arthrobacter sp. NIO-1057]SCC13241.1 Sensor histidine kinase regulating citrate/malate metabolism [Arthrobacter sp. NIO-1057]